MLRTKVKLGLHTIEVEAETIKLLIEQIAKIQDLDKTRDGVPAVLFYAERGGYKFYGFRDKDGAELQFGQKREGDQKDNLFGYHPLSENWKGFKKFVPEPQNGERRQQGQPALQGRPAQSYDDFKAPGFGDDEGDFPF